jgi:hypothetical protein
MPLHGYYKCLPLWSKTKFLNKFSKALQNWVTVAFPSLSWRYATCPMGVQLLQPLSGAVLFPVSLHLPSHLLCPEHSCPLTLFLFLFFIIHMCIQGLGHFSPLPPSCLTLIQPSDLSAHIISSGQSDSYIVHTYTSLHSSLIPHPQAAYVHCLMIDFISALPTLDSRRVGCIYLSCSPWDPW